MLLLFDYSESLYNDLFEETKKLTRLTKKYVEIHCSPWVSNEIKLSTSGHLCVSSCCPACNIHCIHLKSWCKVTCFWDQAWLPIPEEKNIISKNIPEIQASLRIIRMLIKPDSFESFLKIFCTQKYCVL